MDLRQRITRRLRADYDATRVNATVTIDAAAKLAALEAEDDTETGQYNLLLNAQDAAGTRHLPALHLAEPNLQPLTAAGLNLPTETDVQRPDTPAGEPVVVVGGRYVVGENPRRVDGSRPSLTPGRVVTAGLLDEAGNQAVRISGSYVDSLDPRHLTPAPEPAAAPTVDDYLLMDLGLSFRDAIDRDEDLLDADTVRFILALEPGQRLRAAWWAQKTDAADDHIAQLVRERDEARATKDLHKERQQELEAALNAAERERDEYIAHHERAASSLRRAERERDEARAERDERRQAADYFDSRYQEQHAKTRAAEATLERLRAAQQLPDVGPVTRTDPDEDGWTWLRVGDHRGFFNPHISADDHRLSAARELALAAFLDAEADNTSSDDEDVEPDAEFLFTENEQWAHKLSVGEWAAAIRALDAHRARGGQEADPAVEFLKRCAHCQAAWNQKTPHEECYQVENGGAACCCKEAGRG